MRTAMLASGPERGFTKSARMPRSVSGDEWRMLFAQAKACVYPFRSPAPVGGVIHLRY